MAAEGAGPGPDQSLDAGRRGQWSLTPASGAPLVPLLGGLLRGVGGALIRDRSAKVEQVVVLDPFAGSGTTLIAGQAAGRSYGLETHPWWRVAEAKLSWQASADEFEERIAEVLGDVTPAEWTDPPALLAKIYPPVAGAAARAASRGRAAPGGRRHRPARVARPRVDPPVPARPSVPRSGSTSCRTSGQGGGAVRSVQRSRPA